MRRLVSLVLGVALALVYRVDVLVLAGLNLMRRGLLG